MEIIAFTEKTCRVVSDGVRHIDHFPAQLMSQVLQSLGKIIRTLSLEQGQGWEDDQNHGGTTLPSGIGNLAISRFDKRPASGFGRTQWLKARPDSGTGQRGLLVPKKTLKLVGKNGALGQPAANEAAGKLTGLVAALRRAL